VLITAFLIILQTLGYSISGVLAFGGLGGMAVAFAAKDLLANFFGGAMVYMDKPFKVGEWVRSPDRSIEGTVEHIGWRTTRIRRFDKRPITVPNGVFTSLVIENPSRMTNRRINETVGIRYSDAEKMGAITDAVRDYLRSSSDIDQQQTIIVNFNAFGPSSLDFFFYCLTTTTNWVEFHRVKHAVMLKVLQIIEEHGAEVAFPTRTLEIVRQAAVEAQHA
ncbi:MAG: mechanosensitive ion channel family protein, partial [Oceanococcaceae bacterium]